MAGQFVLSYPFRFDMENQRFATVNSDTDTYKAQQISAFLKTEKSERALFPAFGIEDPVFHKFDSASFLDDFLNFYKSDSIVIESVDVQESSGKAENIAVKFK